jgi:hypothetical protein
MSAAATAAGYLFHSGILERRRQQARWTEVRYRMTERYDEFQRTTTGTFRVKPVQVTYRRAPDMNWLRRLLFRFGIGEPIITFGPVIVGIGENRRGIATEECEAGWRAGYNIGSAQGQLEGRRALSDEIEQEFGLHAGQEQMTADDAQRIKARQVH